jgi:phthiocerol/phthiodiolone dimycocerosyl transferase-like enzyme
METRELSPTERWFWIADQLATNNITARVRVDGEVSADRLRAGLAALLARHPLLGRAIAAEPDGTKPRFVPADRPIPLREVLLDRPDDLRWLSEMDERELAEPVDWRRGPLARAVVVSQPGQVHDLILTVPHCVSDGTTVLALLRQWVRLTAAPSGPVAPGSTLSPEDRFPARYRGEPPAPPKPAASPAFRLVPDSFVPFPRRRSRMLHRFLDGDVVADLALACKRNDVTMHGLLAAAMVAAVARDAGTPAPDRVGIGSPIDFRDELEPPVSEDEVGSFVSALPAVVAHRPDDLWSMARSVNDQLRAGRRRGDHFSQPLLLAGRGPAGVADSGPFVQFMEDHGPFNVFMSNMGRFDFPDTAGTWRLSGAHVVGGISVIGYFASVVATCHGRLTWNFVYIDEAIPRDRAERLADDCVAIAVEAAGLSAPARTR